MTKQMLRSLPATLAVLLVAEILQANPPPIGTLEASYDLPETIGWAQDVRWASDAVVWIASGTAGTFACSLREAESLSLELELPPLSGAGAYGFHSRLTSTSKYLVVTAPARSIFWKQLDQDSGYAGREGSFDLILDVDAARDRMLILGARRDSEGRYAPQGTIGWLGTLTDKGLQVEPFYDSISGPGAGNMDFCGILDLGAVRFLQDGSFVVVPGVEPGVFWYGADRKLKRTWDTGSLGIDTGCDIDEKEAHRFSASLQTRHRAWINKRQVVDEVLALPQGIGLVTRSRSADETRWALQILTPSGAVQHYSIPITSSSEFAHLKGDVRASRVVFLIAYYLAHEENEHRLVVLDLGK